MPSGSFDRGFHRFMSEIEKSYRNLKECIKRERAIDILESFMYREPNLETPVEQILIKYNRNLNNNDLDNNDCDIGPLLKEIEYLCISPRMSKRVRVEYKVSTVHCYSAIFSHMVLK